MCKRDVKGYGGRKKNESEDERKNMNIYIFGVISDVFQGMIEEGGAQTPALNKGVNSHLGKLICITSN